MSGERPRLNLKPRDPEAAKRADAEHAEKLKASPFGAARPREQTLASRTGKTEEEILQEAIKHERLRLRLSAPQLEQKQQLEMLVEDAKEQLSLESDEGARENLKEVIKQREAAIDALLDKFSREALAAAQRGEIQRPSERRAMQQMDPITMLEMLAAGNPPGFPGGRGGGRGSGGGGYNPTRDHQMGGIGGRGGGRGRGGWGAGVPFEDSYLPGMPPPMMPLGADLDPDMIDYKSPFQPSQDRF